MSREIKRVSLKFNWPLNKVWKGYINPYNSMECPYCENGMSKEAQELENKWFNWDGPKEEAWQYNLDEDDVKALIKNNRLTDLTHEYKNNKWIKNKNKVITPEMVNEWAKKGFGHDAINRWICIKEKCKKMGVNDSCVHCGGEGFMFLNKKIV
jgi:poly-D-alanine transfer protein DltD